VWVELKIELGLDSKNNDSLERIYPVKEKSQEINNVFLCKCADGFQIFL
jgi:hypothetical protein